MCSRWESKRVTRGTNALTNRYRYRRHLSIYSRVPNSKDLLDSCRHGIGRTSSTRYVSRRSSTKSPSRSNYRRKEIRLSERRTSDVMRSTKRSKQRWRMFVRAWARSRVALTTTHSMTTVSMCEMSEIASGNLRRNRGHTRRRCVLSTRVAPKPKTTAQRKSNSSMSFKITHFCCRQLNRGCLWCRKEFKHSDLRGSTARRSWVSMRAKYRQGWGRLVRWGSFKVRSNCSSPWKGKRRSLRLWERSKKKSGRKLQLEIRSLSISLRLRWRPSKSDRSTQNTISIRRMNNSANNCENSRLKRGERWNSAKN